MDIIIVTLLEGKLNNVAIHGLTIDLAKLPLRDQSHFLSNPFKWLGIYKPFRAN